MHEYRGSAIDELVDLAMVIGTTSTPSSQAGASPFREWQDRQEVPAQG